MPCYDKKLEASREEFFDAELGTRDVDCVITAGELWELVGHFGWDLRSCDETPSPSDSLPEAIQRPGSSSGSYLHSIIEHIQRTHTSREAGKRQLRLDVKQVRNVDYEEYKLIDEDTGKAVFSGARCYGFRNLKTVVVRNRKKYDYVEVMACPGGCINGGGQLKGAERRLVEEAYWKLGGTGSSDIVEEEVKRVMKEMWPDQLRTSYKAVESDPLQLAVNW